MIPAKLFFSFDCFRKLLGERDLSLSMLRTLVRYFCERSLFLLIALAPIANAQTVLPELNKTPTEQTTQSFRQKINNFIDHMVNQYGFERSTLEKAFANTQISERIQKLVLPAALPQQKSWSRYRARFLDQQRIDNGIVFWKTHQKILEQAEEQYGVPAEIIVAILGVETRYGDYTGSFITLDALATLAFAYPPTNNQTVRSQYFEQELEELLLFSRNNGNNMRSIKGSYAGAIGFPQFMPSSIRKWGVDFDHDGVIDIQNSNADAIASIANYLAGHGWQRDLPWVFPATVAENASFENLLQQQGLQALFTLSELENHGVYVSTSAALPNETRYGLIDLQDGENTQYWVATQNFFAITHYNRSFFYAMAVVELAKTLRSLHMAYS